MDNASSKCNFFLKKKNRFCRFRPKLGQQYCPEHACIMGTDTERKRIPCPLNPKHNCYEDEVDKHIKKCNVTKIQQKVEKEVYYVKGVNKGIDSCSWHTISEPQQQISVKDMASESLGKMIDTVNQIYKAYVEPIQTTYFQHPCVQDELCSSRQEDINTVLKNQAALRKELVQQAGLIGQMVREKFLDFEENYIVELGAGKGKLSHWIRKACHAQSNNKFLLVERGSVRYKVDGHQKKDKGENSFKRIKMDIEDLFLGNVPGLENSKAITVVGKHLCGGATDMGIRCAVNTLQFKKQNQSESAIASKFTAEGKATAAEMLQTQAINFIPSEQHEMPSISVNSSPSCVKNVPHVNTGEKVVSNFEEGNPSLKNSQEGETSCSGCANSVSVISPQFSHLFDGKMDSKNKLGKEKLNQEPNKMQSSSEDLNVEPPIKVKKTAENTERSQRLPNGIMIALCCHHRCTWETYVGKSFIESCGLSPQDFDLLTRLSSWATCARGRVRSNRKPDPNGDIDSNPSKNTFQTETPEQSRLNAFKETKDDHISEDLIVLDKNSDLSLRELLSVSEREKIGRQCKRIIDTGRLLYLRSKGMKASLREYVDEDTTPENVVLIAHP